MEVSVYEELVDGGTYSVVYNPFARVRQVRPSAFRVGYLQSTVRVNTFHPTYYLLPVASKGGEATRRTYT